MAKQSGSGLASRIWAAVGGGLVALVGLVIAAGGVWLIVLQGSPYYLLAGAGLLATGALLAARRQEAGYAYAIVLGATIFWALWESGLDFWPLVPRLAAPAVLGLFVLAVAPMAARGPIRNQGLIALAASVVAAFAMLGAALPAVYTDGQAESPVLAQGGVQVPTDPGDWRFYGRDAGGQRFVPVDQITRGNVDQLKVAWTFRTGEPANRGSEDQNTPEQVGDTLYLCTPTNVVIAVDADTGRE
jgi:quinate dehydrogenase (quinone)